MKKPLSKKALMEFLSKQEWEPPLRKLDENCYVIEGMILTNQKGAEIYMKHLEDTFLKLGKQLSKGEEET